LELLIKDKLCFLHQVGFSSPYSLFVYKTSSFIPFNFALNLFNELTTLSLVEPAPFPQNVLPNKIQTVPLTRRLLWEEALGVQKKYGSRYRKPIYKKFRIKNTEETNFFTLREQLFTSVRPGEGDLQLKYVI